METVDVLLSGNILPDADLASAAAQLSGLTGLEQEQALELISSGKEQVVQRGVSVDVGQSYLDQLTAMGIEAWLRPVATPIPPAETPINPYNAPKADLEERSAATGLGGGIWRSSPIKVPAAHGYHWFKDAWKLFRSRPGAWTVALLLSGIPMTLVSIVPIPAAALPAPFLWAFFAGGIAIMAHRQSSGRAIGALHIFSGFSQNFEQLWPLGVCTVSYGIFLVFAGLLLIGVDTLAALANGNLTPELALQGTDLLRIVFGIMILLIPSALSAVFAPTLVTLAGQNTLRGFYKGVLAGLKNWSAFLVSGLILVLFFGGIGLIIAIIWGLVSGFSGGSSIYALVFAIALTLLLVVPLNGAVMMMSYTTTRDIFYQER